MSQLDRSQPYATIQGDSRAAYYQAGHYFDIQGREVSQEDASKPAVGGYTDLERLDKHLETAGLTEDEMNQLVAGASQDAALDHRLKNAMAARKLRERQYAAQEQAQAALQQAQDPASVEPKPDGPDETQIGKAAEEPAAANGATGEDADVTRAELDQLHPRKLARMVEQAGHEAFTGAGSKKRNIDLLLGLAGES